MFIKRVFDIIASLSGLVFFSWLLLLSWAVAALDTRTSGIFIQERIGRYGHPFKIYKLMTLHPHTGRISRIGYWLRNFKLDELPQLLNVLGGSMSMVGPRPDIPGYYDSLEGKDRDVLKLRPGITGPASIKYADEEKLLAMQTSPEYYNDTIIFPDKVRINLHYLKNRTLWLDIKIIFRTIFRTKGNELSIQ